MLTGMPKKIRTTFSSDRGPRLGRDANVLSLGGRVLGDEAAKAIVEVWLNTPFAGGRHTRRTDKIKEMEE